MMNEDIVIEHIKDLSKNIHKLIFDYMKENLNKNSNFYQLLQIVASSGISGTVAALSNIEENTKDDYMRKFIHLLIESFLNSLVDFSVIDKSFEKNSKTE